MACTVYAARVIQLKERYANNAKLKEPSFVTQWNNLWQLANVGRLSRHNVIWLGKKVQEMAEFWITPEQMEMVQQLRERQERAWKRWEKRIAERAAAKEASAARGRGRRKTETPAPVALDNENDPWNLV